MMKTTTRIRLNDTRRTEQIVRSSGHTFDVPYLFDTPYDRVLTYRYRERRHPHIEQT